MYMYCRQYWLQYMYSTYNLFSQISLIDLFSLHSLDDAEYMKAMAEGSGNLEHLNIVLHGPPDHGPDSVTTVW